MGVLSHYVERSNKYVITLVNNDRTCTFYKTEHSDKAICMRTIVFTFRGLQDLPQDIWHKPSTTLANFFRAYK